MNTTDNANDFFRWTTTYTTAMTAVASTQPLRFPTEPEFFNSLRFQPRMIENDKPQKTKIAKPAELNRKIDLDMK